MLSRLVCVLIGGSGVRSSHPGIRISAERPRYIYLIRSVGELFALLAIVMSSGAIVIPRGDSLRLEFLLPSTEGRTLPVC